MMSWSISSPATLSDRETTIPPIEKTASSVVPPPMSTIIEPRTSPIGRLAPRAAAVGSSMRNVSRAPAAMAASQRADGDDVRRGAADHFLRLGAYGQRPLRFLLDGNPRGFVEDNPSSADIHQCICGAEIDSDIK